MLRGYQEVIQKIAEFPVDQKDRPIKPITIANCGELVMRSEAKRSESKAEGQSTVIPGKGSADQIMLQAEKKDIRSQSEPDSESETERRRDKKRRHHHRSRSRTDSESVDEDRSRRHHHKKSKRKKDRSRSPSRPKNAGSDDEKATIPQEETEEQYDARLEREEKERLEAQRKRELERLKRLQEDVPTTNGVRFKGRLTVFHASPHLINVIGRGRMKYLDPELRRD